MRILIAVDVLNDFCAGGSLAVEEGDLVVPVINKLSQKGGYDKVIMVQEWHPENHCSFVTNHLGKKMGDVVDVDGIKQILWPAHAVQNTHGAQFHPGLDMSKVDLIVRKGEDPRIDSYSAFADNGKRGWNSLLEELDRIANAAGITRAEIEIDVVGLALDYCVKATALDAAEVGFKTSVVLDATRAVFNRVDQVAGVLQELMAHNVQAIVAKERLSGLEVPAKERAVDRGIHVI